MEEKSKIADNPSIREVSKFIPAIKIIKFLTRGLKAIGLGGEKVTRIHAAASELLSQTEIIDLPDQFNDAFSDQGWIATNSLSMEVMQEALKHYTNGDKETAEQAILGWFSEDNIDLFAIQRSKSFNKANKRWDQLREALSLTMEERFIAAVPLILIACDGFASDVLGKSPFEQNADLTSFDSIVGHPTSLPTLIGKLTKGVRKSSDEELILPLRHGILHGRSLGYANQLVCFKAWLLMIALVDWAIDVREEEARKKKQQEHENFNWADFFSQARRVREDRRTINEFQAIQWQSPFEKEMNPEWLVTAFIDFLEAWKTKNFGKMAKRAVNITRIKYSQMAGSMRRDAELVELIEYQLQSVRQSTVARAEAIVFMRGKTHKGILEGEFKILAFRHTPDGKIAMPTDKGDWSVQQGCIFDLMHHRTINRSDTQS